MTQSPAVSRRKGQPLLMLALLGSGWIAARVMLWDIPLDPNPRLASVWPAQPLSGAAKLTIQPLRRAGAVRNSPAPLRPRATREMPVIRTVRSAGIAPREMDRDWPDLTVGAPATALSPPQSNADAASPPPTAMPLYGSRSARPLPPAARRWSIDGWYAWRRGSGLPRRATGVPFAGSYGGTQGGVLARLDLAEGPRRPQAFVRLTHVPDRPAQADMALGIGLRPLGAIPVRIQAEARATRSAGRTSIAPAAALVSELPAIGLPLGFRAEGYGQAGWVGGHFATAFVDGQMRVDRPVAGLGPVELRLGGGAWGGAQEFAGRLDVGPGATFDLRGAGVPARVSIDYRFQIAGNARPGDGMAVTPSTGF